jgi:hypothetical protein
MLKSQREQAKAALERARAQCGTVTMIDPAKVAAFCAIDG